ncbi:hypothetical protein G9A89_013871 [Geosiphon pyriformis]|nr:hypothetical protein G9A89_013871 [Geosiphon pyriformis]
MTSVWHPDSHMLSGFTSQASTVLCTYLMKVVHRKLPVAICKRLYDKCYPGVLCLMCGDVELSDYAAACTDILLGRIALWKSLLVGCSPASSPMLHTLLAGCHDLGAYMRLCKGFVLRNWVNKATVHFKDCNRAFLVMADFVRCLAEKHQCGLWLIRAKFRVDMECCGLVCALEILVGLSADSIEHLFGGVVHLLGIDKAFAISFGLHKASLFFSGICDNVKVYVGV